ncbi:FMN-dependent NADH-azoreductase AzoR1, partial [Pseudomonas aeruginosa]
MSRILAVHASPRGERSQSRRLAEVFLAAYREAHPQARVARREVGRVPLPAVTEAFVAAAFHPQPEQRSLAMQADLA